MPITSIKSRETGAIWPKTPHPYNMPHLNETDIVRIVVQIAIRHFYLYRPRRQIVPLLLDFNNATIRPSSAYLPRSHHTSQAPLKARLSPTSQQPFNRHSSSQASRLRNGWTDFRLLFWGRGKARPPKHSASADMCVTAQNTPVFYWRSIGQLLALGVTTLLVSVLVESVLTAVLSVSASFFLRRLGI